MESNVKGSLFPSLFEHTFLHNLIIITFSSHHSPNQRLSFTTWILRPNFLRFFGVWETEFGLREMELPQSGKFKEQKWLRFIGLGFKRPRDYVVLVIIWLGNLNKYTHWETVFCLCKVPYFKRIYESHLHLHLMEFKSWKTVFGLANDGKKM